MLSISTEKICDFDGNDRYFKENQWEILIRMLDIFAAMFGMLSDIFNILNKMLKILI